MDLEITIGVSVENEADALAIIKAVSVPQSIDSVDIYLDGKRMDTDGNALWEA